MDLLTTEDLSARLGVDERTLRRWRRAGCPSVPGKGRSVLYDLEAVRSWMAAVGRTGEQGGAPEERPAAGEARPAAVEDDGQDEDAPVDTATLRDQLLGARVRKEVALAQRHELDFAIRRGDLLTRSEVVAGCQRIIQDTKAVLEIMPGKLAARLLGQPYDVIYGLIAEEVAQTLEQLASGVGGVQGSP